MKFFTLFTLGAALTAAASAWGASPSQGDDDLEVTRLDARLSRYDYRPSQVLVKFKDDSGVALRAPSASAGAKTQVATVDQALQQLGVTAMEQLMPLSGHRALRPSAPAFNGKAVPATDMSRAYRLFLSPQAEPVEVMEAVETLRGLPQVEWAEPNYIIHTLADADAPDINDPYYSVQWGLQDINMPALWGQEVLSKDGPVIAIIDTGVDIYHPDLVNNIWTNADEASGAQNYDDDRNGFRDDVHGYDFVNNTGMIADYNGHGTHCAGIAAASGFNGLGIIGANPDALVMPLTAMQSDGTGDVGTIIRAVDYAAANGASVISMSLGTYAQSVALEQALGRAYQQCVLVAAAGNDGLCLNHSHPERGQSAPAPMFPAAYTFVLGVQASTQGAGRAAFSNYDDDGPVYSDYPEEQLYNYELTAPGAGIMSTFPNGQYKRLNGTSMATPLVAGALSRLMQCRPVDSKEELFADLINSRTANGDLDIYAAYARTDADRTPQLQIVSTTLSDSQGDGDGRPDAGETIEIYPTVRNTCGTAQGITLSIEPAETANPWCEILTKDDVDFGSTLSAYAKGVSQNPLVVRFAPDVADGRHCLLKVTATCNNGAVVAEQTINLSVENCEELTGILRDDMTLTPDKNYVVTGAFGIPEGRTLTILPGTTLKFRSGSSFSANAGTVIANGLPGQMITFTMAEHETGPVGSLFFGSKYHKLSYIDFKFIDFNNISGPCGRNDDDLELNNCIYRFCNASAPLQLKYYTKSNVYDNIAVSGNGGGDRTKQSNFIENRTIGREVWGICYAFSKSNIFSHLICSSQGDILDIVNVDIHGGAPSIYTPAEPNYLGTGREDIARKGVLDIHYSDNISFREYDLSNMLTRPVAEAHGIVWKVVVDGYDAQDQYEEMPPLGVGRHKFEVYFNRAMNTAVAPKISMGVREPYTQTPIAADGTWSADSTLYTAYLDITGRQKIDGVNRIYVYGAEDNEYFELIPERYRFNVNVQAAGSLADGFTGEASVGRVNLAWDNTESHYDDMLGYNLYRYQVDDQGTVEGSERRLNQSVITPQDENLYTDYDVTTGNTYVYYYRVLRTSLEELDPSKRVAVTPLAADMGDANGSGAVDVLDVLTTVNHIAGQEPKPFIFDAADMNADQVINVIDVVGIVQKLTAPAAAPLLAGAQADPETAYWWMEEGKIYVNTPCDVAGVQLNLDMPGGREAGVSVSPSGALQGLETTGAWTGPDQYVFLAYSLSGRRLDAGIHTLVDVSAPFDVKSIILSDTSASPREIPVVYADPTAIEDVAPDGDAEAQAASAARLRGVYNVYGVKVAADASALPSLPQGVYIVNGVKTVNR